jgi:hypothetical protein
MESGFVATMAEQQIREARLRPEFAHAYPWLNWGTWEAAALVADRVLAWLIADQLASIDGPERVLPGRHFDFRGASLESSSPVSSFHPRARPRSCPRRTISRRREDEYSP